MPSVDWLSSAGCWTDAVAGAAGPLKFAAVTAEIPVLIGCAARRVGMMHLSVAFVPRIALGAYGGCRSALETRRCQAVDDAALQRYEHDQHRSHRHEAGGHKDGILDLMVSRQSGEPGG